MHVLFVHQNRPAQFGHVARRLVRDHGFRCTFLSQRPSGVDQGVEMIQYHLKGGATNHNHYCTRSFENAVGHAHAVYEACKAAADLRPDLIVGHSGFGSTLFLRELWDAPIVNYFEYYYRPHGSDLDFRPDAPPAELDVLRSHCRNAMILLDLQNCAAGYSPTRWQRSLFPAEYQGKIRAIFDGVDLDLWRRRDGLPRAINGRAVPPGTRIVTYVSRGFESMRGFDVFMKVARRVYLERPDVLFVVVGSDRVAYGGDMRRIQAKTFRQHVLEQDDYDMSKFVFTGTMPSDDLARTLSMGDAHVYLTVPFVLSWSLFNAMACGAVVVGSDTGPVRELVRHEETGLLADFFDVDGLARQVLRVLDDPAGHRRLGEAARRRIEEEYSLDRILPQLLDLYDATLGRAEAGQRPMRADDPAVLPSPRAASVSP
ncbi:glycosyltransferase [Planctomyces sp. SH-PL62]|uniref:glycosyltransferase n=1 Tax=Planctomyces sp. SH-PL62 TaxID=1636152 RepID=UPI00078B5A05|nr:glycosyltransferase [Planctomyces sp. SH-PL62]AMV38240.1 2-deoxystreptamine N-acetyl-D-glucosaminyltransferase [Planctomyces sp. SH-PL62]